MHSHERVNYYMDVFHVFEKTVAEIMGRGMFGALRDELEYIFFRKVYFDLSRFIISQYRDRKHRDIMEMETYIKTQFPLLRDNQYMTHEDQAFYESMEHLVF